MKSSMLFKKLELTYRNSIFLSCLIINIVLFKGGVFAQTSALYFDGINDYATVDITLPNDYTFEFYMKFHDLSIKWETILNFNGFDWAPWFGTDNYYGNRFEFWDGSYLFETESVLEEDIWYHIALVKHNDNIYIYLDGIRIFIYEGVTTVPDGPFSIGGQEISYNGNVSIDELRVSSVARYTADSYVTSTCQFLPDSNTYALYHFNDGSSSQIAIDDSGNGHDMRLGASVEIDDSDPEWIIDGIGPIEVDILGDSTVCQSNLELTYISNISENVVEYVWQIDGDLEIITGQGTSTIVVQSSTNVSEGIAEICLTVDVGCGLNIEDCQLIQIQPTEEIILTDLPEEMICESANPINLETNQNNQTGQWSGIGIQGNMFFPEIAGLGVHQLDFSPQNDECNNGVFLIEVIYCDCAGIPNGNFLIDDCGECLEPSDPDFNSCLDCEGTPNGNAILDDCGECLEPSDPDFNSCLDCEGVPFGFAEINECGECHSSSTQSLSQSCVEDNLIYIPSAFSPDFNGYNDIFQIFEGQGVVQEVVYFRVFNRWGAEVFQAFNFDIHSYSDWWDGRFNGEHVSEGVYVYFLEVRFINGVTKKYNGGVTLVR